MSLDWIFKFSEYILGFSNQIIFQKREHMNSTKGSAYESEMHVENVAKKADSRSLTYMNNFRCWNLQLVEQTKIIRLVFSREFSDVS